MPHTDLVVIGAGVAGLNAATHAARQGLDVLVIERMGAGGQVHTVGHIANHPDYPDGISGYELGPALQETAEQAGVRFRLDSVSRLERADGLDAAVFYRVHGETGMASARAVLVAAGSVRKMLGVPGERRLEGRGVSHCASCDGPLFNGEPLCVVGGGDSAVGEAVLLAQHASAITLVFAGDALHAQAYLIDALNTCDNIRLMPRTTVTSIEGSDCVTGVRTQVKNGQDRLLPVSGVFVYAGLRPATGFLHDLVRLDGTGRIVCDSAGRSAMPGIYAAGDIRAGTPCTLAAVQQNGLAVADTIARDFTSQGNRT